MKKTVWIKTKEKCEECGKNLYKIENDLSNYRCHSESIDCFPGDVNKFKERMKERKSKKEVNKIFMLICENATALGGPMAYATTEYMWSKLFSSKDKAKAYAVNYAKRPKEEIRWQGRGKITSWDSGPYFFEIKEEKVL